jgi:mycofactocin system glycosyltransferase
VSYVPAAAIVCRVDAVRSIGGFDPTLRFGEDVDLVWRLRRAGWRCRYEPASEVSHEPRSTLRDWALQRVGYGTSAAPLAARHPGALAPLRMSGWSAGVWALVALRRPLLALGLAGWTCRALQRKLTDLPAQEAWRLAGLGHLFAGRQVASAITRTWWPIALVAGLLFPRLRPALVAAAVVPALLDARSPEVTMDPVRYALLRIADDAAYGAGVWRGVLRRRSAAALRPSFTNWPPRRAGD